MGYCWRPAFILQFHNITQQAEAKLSRWQSCDNLAGLFIPRKLIT